MYRIQDKRATRVMNVDLNKLAKKLHVYPIIIFKNCRVFIFRQGKTVKTSESLF